MSVGARDWLACARWLDACGVLPDAMHHNIQTNRLKLQDFAYALRDGVILCNLINKLVPSYIDVANINKSSSGQLASRQNTKLFLGALESYFEFNKQDLFEPDMLYNTEIECVLKTLATLSQTQVAQEIVKNGFTLSGDNDSTAGEIYYNIQPDAEEEESYYMLDPFGTENNDNELYEKMIKGIPATAGPELSKRKSNGANVKKEHVVKEICETEMKFVSALEILTNDFLVPLSKTIHDRDRQVIYINIEVLKSLHTMLVTRLREACQDKGHGRTSRICKVFDNFKQQLMKEYVTYFSNMQTAIDKVDYLTNKNEEFRKVLAECRDKSKMGTFKLSDLMRLPYQRVLKYHILFQELNKQTDEKHDAKKEILTTWTGLKELSTYLNESQRDNACLKQIENLSKHLMDFNFTNSTKINDYGHLIKDESVRIKSNDGVSFARTRALLLFDKALFICKSKGDNYYYKETILMNEFKLDENSNSDSNSALNLVLHNTDGSKVYTLCCKNDKQKKEWKKCICDALDKVHPIGYNSNGHSFSLKDFGDKITPCQLCKEVLFGVFHQGYECGKCGAVAHKTCLNKYPTCSRSSVTLREHSIIRPMSQQRSTRNLHYVVKAVHEYKGRPIPPFHEWPILKFNSNDLITVTDDDDDEWWKGFRTNGPRNEGYFPRNRVSVVENLLQSESSFDNGSATRGSLPPVPQLPIAPKHPNNKPVSIAGRMSSIEIESRSWYCDVDRDLAQKILKSIPNQTAIFLVRPRQDNGYAISIKFNNNIEHIKIHTTKIGIDQIYYFLVEQNRFSSITQLIQHYMNNSLEDNFPQLRTTLGTPFKDALPMSVGYATAIHDYVASDDVTVELKRGERVSVVDKKAGGWWLIYNNNGHLGYAPSTYLQETNY